MLDINSRLSLKNIDFNLADSNSTKTLAKL